MSSADKIFFLISVEAVPTQFVFRNDTNSYIGPVTFLSVYKWPYDLTI